MPSSSPSSLRRRRALRPLLAAGAAIALLGGGAVALIALATGPGADAPAGPATPAASPAPLASPAPPAADPRAVDPRAADPQAARLGDPASGGLVTNPPLPGGPAGGPAARPAHPGVATPDLSRAMPSRARYVVSSAIEAQVPAVAACFRQHPPGFARRTALNRRSFVSGRGVLRLDLQPVAGELLVNDARIELAGNATDAELECARRALRGAALTVDGVGPGPNVAMVYPIP